MNCAEFERDLASLLTAPDDERRGGSALARLRKHVAGCPGCARCTDLLDWLELPSSERDPFDDPGPGYWDRFDGRLRERIAQETSARHRRRIRLGVAAASLIAAGFLIPWLIRDREDPGEAPPARVADPAEVELDEILVGADPETALREMEIVVGVADTWSLPGNEAGVGAASPLLPAEGEMEIQDRRRLIEWLESETERLEGGSA